MSPVHVRSPFSQRWEHRVSLLTRSCFLHFCEAPIRSSSCYAMWHLCALLHNRSVNQKSITLISNAGNDRSIRA